MPDIDLDFADRNQVLNLIKHIPATIINGDNVKKHNTGVYCQNIPFNPITGLASIDYKTAESRGYFKIDFLNVHIYNGIKNNDHLDRLMSTEPVWDLLEQEEFVDLLFHVSGHGKVLKQMKPKNLSELAAVLAMIRPAKKHLIGKSWPEIQMEIWNKPENGEYYFKKSHGFAYAMAVIVHMNLICEQLKSDQS